MTFDFENSTSLDWIGALPAAHAKTIEAMLSNGNELRGNRSELAVQGRSREHLPFWSK